ncbi:MAG TPA: hypothetical protein VGM33_24795 [Baekduia sp.]
MRRDLDPDRRQELVALLSERNAFAASPDELAVYAAMLAPVMDEVDRLCEMDGIRYAEPAPTFRPLGIERA